MKLEDLPDLPTDTRELIGATEHAIRERLAYAKELLESAMLGMTGERPTKPYIRAFIEKLNAEGL